MDMYVGASKNRLARALQRKGERKGEGDGE